MVAEVIVDIASNDVDKVFDYLVLDNNVKRGSRVIVPFGAKHLEGFVINIKEKSSLPESKLKGISHVLDDKNAITEEMLSLLFAMAKKYKLPRAIILRQFLPSEMRTGKVKEVYKKLVFLNPEIEMVDMLNSLRSSAKTQKSILGYISLSKEKEFLLSSLNLKFGASSVKSLIEKDFLRVRVEKRQRTPYTSVDSQMKVISLTSEQQKAIKTIQETDKSTSLIFGVTGSGKTEIYLSAIQSAVEKGKTAIMLVPEIALTPQMLGRLRERFGDKAAILHSGLSAGEKFDEWWRLRNGEAKIAIGARSAIFAPLENLGVIIIDEEHDGSYQSDVSPRYDTRDIAKFRRDYNKCKLILGSATPSIESFLKAKRGVYTLITLKDRYNKNPMPEVVIADMRKELRRGNNTPFSSALISALQECMDSGNQAIIFLNRRGYSKNVICRECGHVVKCEDCDVSLTYHSDENLLKCHYCNARYKMLDACPSCGSVHISYQGFGTQRIVYELEKLFPDKKILRMDNDSTKNKEGHLKIVKDFADRKADILVGTQMIVKGHDFSAVTLVGILDADMSLHFSDYKSGERTFQLITQVAGRSGRREDRGKVVLQTFTPDNSILKLATAYDYEGFFAREIALRESTKFPPFSVILRVMVVGGDEEQVIESLKEVYLALKEVYEQNKDEFIFFNKMKSPIKRIETKFRYQVLMRINESNKSLKELIYDISLRANNKKGVTIYVEENPNNIT